MDPPARMWVGAGGDLRERRTERPIAVASWLIPALFIAAPAETAPQAACLAEASLRDPDPDQEERRR